MAETNQSLARGLTILEAFSRETPELGVREIARLCGIGRTVAHRLVQTLAARGFLEQNPETLRYRIGARAFEVGHQYATASGVEDAALPILRALTKDHELNAYLGVLRGDHVVYLVALQSRGPIVIRATPGSRTHLHSTALGKVLLAAEPEARARALLAGGPLPRLTRATRVDARAVLAELAEVRRRGWALSDEENIAGVLAVGAPVRDRSGRVIAAVSGACPRYLTPDDRVAAIADVIVDAAARVSRSLGFAGVAAATPRPITRGRPARGASRC
jgi:DNA-binding IclR family transcriptional regulator